jgi:NAD(P)-dependent dehydrogenase (short-subunit alcohol dehydrogenase family)
MMAGYAPLQGKSAIVTGGSQGIGEAIARAYAKAGAKVAVLARTLAKAEAVAVAIRTGGGQATAFNCDVSSHVSIKNAVLEIVRNFGGVDILVNNAAAYLMSPLGATGEDAIDVMLATNIKGPFLLAQEVLPMLERAAPGKIINIGSIFGNDGFPGSSIYCATKGAISLLTKTLALELRDRNIQVNAIAPGWVETPLNEGYRATDRDFMRRAEERFGGPGAWMKPDEIAGAAVFLASRAADSVTGTTLFVDRGWSAY